MLGRQKTKQNENNKKPDDQMSTTSNHHTHMELTRSHHLYHQHMKIILTECYCQVLDIQLFSY